MITVHVDAAAYSEVAKGLVRRVLSSLIREFADHGILDLSKELDEDGLNFVYTTAFSVLVQFEDFRGHASKGFRHPVVVGFMSNPITGPSHRKEAEEILTSPKRTDLHGKIDDYIIKEVFEEFRKDR